MKALLSHESGTFELTDRSEPSLVDGTAIVSVAFCGLCATDIEILEGRFWGSYPVIPGHEISGTIVDIASTSSDLDVGQRVTIDPNMPCGKCPQCVSGLPHLCTHLRAIGVTEPGGFAELVRIPIGNLYPVPKAVELDQAALCEPLACVLHGIDRAEIHKDDAVVIYGAGFIGLLFAYVLTQRGAADLTLIEPSPQRATTAADLGFQVISDLGLQMASAPSLSIDCSGNINAIRSAIEGTRPGGRVLLFGVADPEAQLPFSPYEVFRRELTILGSCINTETQQRAVDLLSEVELGPLVTHCFRLEDFADAVEMKRADPQALKILVKPGNFIEKREGSP